MAAGFAIPSSSFSLVCRMSYYIITYISHERDVSHICPISLYPIYVLYPLVCHMSYYIITYLFQIADNTYYSDSRDQKIYRVNKWTGGQKVSLYRDQRAVMGIRVYSADVQSGKKVGVVSLRGWGQGAFKSWEYEYTQLKYKL